MLKVLTIAGFDPSSGAGATADLQVFAAHRLFGTACLTAMTVQSTRGVVRMEAVDPVMLHDSLECLTDDICPAGIKIGMLASEVNVRVVADFLEKGQERLGGVPVVLDPVLLSSSGARLLEVNGMDAMREALLPRVTWVTPNVGEVAALLGLAKLDENTVEEAAQTLREGFGLANLVVTGGDLRAPDDFVLIGDADGKARRGEWLQGEWVNTRSTHGTGCAFSSALLCALVSGLEGVEAVRAAKLFVAGALRHAVPIGHGKGPLNYYWQHGFGLPEETVRT